MIKGKAQEKASEKRERGGQVTESKPKEGSWQSVEVSAVHSCGGRELCSRLQARACSFGDASASVQIP